MAAGDKPGCLAQPGPGITNPSYSLSLHGRDSLAGMVQASGITWRLGTDATLYVGAKSAMPPTMTILACILAAKYQPEKGTAVLAVSSRQVAQSG
jgi:hypothetical protein